MGYRRQIATVGRPRAILVALQNLRQGLTDAALPMALETAARER
jgi:hypothetical protein